MPEGALFDGVKGYLHAAFRNVIPEPADREPMSWGILKHGAPAILGLFLLAFLARSRPDSSRVLRMLILPLVIWATLKAAFGFYLTQPGLNIDNWSLCLWGEVMIAKALDFGLAKHGRRKLEEPASKEKNQAIVSNGSGKAADRYTETATIERPAFLRYVPSWLREAAELCSSMRGIGWDFGAGVYIPQHSRPIERAPFLRATFSSLIQNILILDVLDSSLKLLPGLGAPSGGSIFYPQLPPLQRYAVSTAIHLISGYCLIEGFAICYDSLALWGVMALHNAPSSWPPIMDDPWASTSLHEFWAKRWHQLLRRTFIISGGFPGRLIAGNTGMIYGTFVASGLFHELAIYAMGQGLDYRVVLFFSVQGPLLTVETLWRKATGGMVGGWAGRVWVFSVLVVLGQGTTDSWHTRGLAGGMVIPPALSPMRQLVFPALALIAQRWKA